MVLECFEAALHGIEQRHGDTRVVSTLNQFFDGSFLLVNLLLRRSDVAISLDQMLPLMFQHVQRTGSLLSCPQNKSYWLVAGLARALAHLRSREEPAASA